MTSEVDTQIVVPMLSYEDGVAALEWLATAGSGRRDHTLRSGGEPVRMVVPGRGCRGASVDVPAAVSVTTPGQSPARSRQGPGPRGGAEPVPRVDHGDGPDQLGQFDLGEVGRRAGEDLVRDAPFGQPGGVLGELERGPFALGEERRLVPDR